MNKKYWKNLFFDSLFPFYCPGCKTFIETEKEIYICKECFEKLPRLSGFFCPICQKRSGEPKKCHLKHLDGLMAASDYQNPIISEMIGNLKYRFMKKTSRPLAQLMIEVIQKNFSESELKEFSCMAIPLHPDREKWRGYNQSQKLTEIISQSLKINPIENVLIRKKSTTEQAKLKNNEERRKNIENAFESNGNPPLKIILIDDVVTSGNTLDSAAQTLKKAGVKTVIGLAMAK